MAEPSERVEPITTETLWGLLRGLRHSGVVKLRIIVKREGKHDKKQLLRDIELTKVVAMFTKVHWLH